MTISDFGIYINGAKKHHWTVSQKVHHRNPSKMMKEDRPRNVALILRPSARDGFLSNLTPLESLGWSWFGTDLISWVGDILLRIPGEKIHIACLSILCWPAGITLRSNCKQAKVHGPWSNLCKLQRPPWDLTGTRVRMGNYPNVILFQVSKLF